MAKNKTNQEALDYHSQGRPGKIEVIPTKDAKTQRKFFLCVLKTSGLCVKIFYYKITNNELKDEVLATQRRCYEKL